MGGLVRVTGCPVSAPVRLFDVAGRHVATAPADATGAAHISTTALAPGVYVVRAANGAAKRLVVE